MSFVNKMALQPYIQQCNTAISPMSLYLQSLMSKFFYIAMSRCQFLGCTPKQDGGQSCQYRPCTLSYLVLTHTWVKTPKATQPFLKSYTQKSYFLNSTALNIINDMRQSQGHFSLQTDNRAISLATVT